MEKTIKINIPDGYDDVKFNEKTNEIEFIKKDDKPRSWDEYCKQVRNNPCYAAHTNCLDGIVEKYDNRIISYVNTFNTEEEAKAFIALGKLIQLRDAWIGDWRPYWDNSFKNKYTIYFKKNKIVASWNTEISHFLSFPTEKMRDDFLETFRDLIEEAKTLI